MSNNCYRILLGIVSCYLIATRGYCQDTTTNANKDSSITLSPKQILTLLDLETYIKQHKHLSDVPLASVVTDNGIDLGGNQTILLKKIEELTYYVITQVKEL